MEYWAPVIGVSKESCVTFQQSYDRVASIKQQAPICAYNLFESLRTHLRDC
jgi:hypothetical protein